MIWIDATKQLPKDNELVLVIVAAPPGNPEKRIEIMYFDCEECEWQNSLRWARLDEVSYWMKLPPMPEEADGK